MRDIDFLIDKVFKEIEPLEVKAVRESDTRLIVTATNFETGQPTYFDNREDKDIFEVLRASKAAPVVYKKEGTFTSKLRNIYYLVYELNNNDKNMWYR